jgi:hypothetical protein
MSCGWNEGRSLRFGHHKDEAKLPRKRRILKPESRIIKVWGRKFLENKDILIGAKIAQGGNDGGD